MWCTRTAALLASACLLGALSAQALWPHPSNLTSNPANTFVRFGEDLSLQLADGTDQSRVPADLKDAMDAAGRLASSVELWPLVPDRGECYRDDVAKAKLVSSVYITVLELMPETQPNPCVKKAPVEAAIGEVMKPRALQQPFQGRTKPTDPPKKEEPTGYGLQPASEKDGNWDNACSIASHSIKELSYESSKQHLDLEKDKSAPADLGFLDAEMYHLLVPDDGSSIRLTSYTALGALRGLQTLLQLIYTLPPNPEVQPAVDGKKTPAQRFIRNVPINITDRPAYPYRGLLLDTARNWFDIPAIRKLIDTMSFVKLNQLHWHATDTQSWPLAFNDEADANGIKLSQLAANGSYGWFKAEDGTVKKMVYTEDDIRGIIDYAAARGVNVIVETDMPAHMLEGVDSLDAGELMACPNVLNWNSVAAEPPSGQLRLVSNDTVLNTTAIESFKIPEKISKFASAVLGKVSSLSKSLYVSSGGDEPNYHCWNLSTEANMEPYLTPFMSLVTNVTTTGGKKGMVWEEMAVKFPKVAETLGDGSLVEIWNDANNSRTALINNMHVNIVLAPVSYFYLDCGSASFLGNYTGNLWCPYVSWQQTYSYFPEQTIANATATPEVAPLGSAFNVTQRETYIRQRFVGGEHAVWTETIDATNLEPKVWPRAAAGAEIYWSGDKINGTTRDKVEALPRMMDLRYRLVEMGVKAEPLQPLWCATRDGWCNMH